MIIELIDEKCAIANGDVHMSRCRFIADTLVNAELESAIFELIPEIVRSDPRASFYRNQRKLLPFLRCYGKSLFNER